jgi:hypothetical protein
MDREPIGSPLEMCIAVSGLREKPTVKVVVSQLKRGIGKVNGLTATSMGQGF